MEQKQRGRKPIPQYTIYILVVIASIILSAGGILIAVHRGDLSRGGQGGAVAVAFSFLILFLRRDYGARVYKAITTDFPNLRAQIRSLRKGDDPATANSDGVAELKRQITGMTARFETEAKGQRAQNLALAAASIIGTLVWGFGDRGAQYLIERRGIKPALTETLSSVLTDHCVLTDRSEPTGKNRNQVAGTELIEFFRHPKAQELGSCLPLINRTLEDEPILVLIVGRVDKRELARRSKRIYGSNFTLAYQRAAAFRAYLIERYQQQQIPPVRKRLPVEEFESRILTLAAGPNHVGDNVDKYSLAEDRSLEVYLLHQ